MPVKKRKKTVAKKKKIVKKKVVRKKAQPDIVSIISDTVCELESQASKAYKFISTIKNKTSKEVADIFSKFSADDWMEYLHIPTEKDLKCLRTNLKHLERWMKKQMKSK